MKASFTKRNLLELLISKGAKHSLPIFKTSINTSALAYNAVLSLSSLNTELTEHHTSNKSYETKFQFSVSKSKNRRFLVHIREIPLTFEQIPGQANRHAFVILNVYDEIFSSHANHTQSACLVLSLPCIA